MSSDNNSDPLVEDSSAAVAIRTDAQLVEVVGPQMQRLAAQVSDLFPEREHLINQIMFALLTREHVLFHGVFGTGKTQLVNCIFGSFVGPNTFSLALNKFHTEANVFGIPDPRKMREEGIIHYPREGGLLDAHFAELDEILDASGPLLRVLLGVLNEREFKRGKQNEKALLHTALASTNGDPDKMVKQNDDLGAVIDRFLFRCKVNYLSASASRQKMFANYLQNATTTIRIPYQSLDRASLIVAKQNLICDPQMIACFERILETYKSTAGAPPVSDRRACKLLRLVQASAVLHGRLQVQPEDFLAVRWGLCTGNDNHQHEAFKAAAQPIVKELEKTCKGNVDQLCLRLIAEYFARIPVVPAQCTDEQLVRFLREVSTMRRALEELRPELPSTDERKRALQAQLALVTADINDRIAG